MSNKIALLIPVWNGAIFIPPLFNSIVNLEFPKNDIFVLIADNGSTDNSLAIINDYSIILKNNKINFLVISIGENKGVPFAYNVLLDNLPIGTSYVLRLDQDVILDRYCINEMIQAFRLIDKVGAVGPKFLDYYGEKIVHGPGMMTRWNFKPYQGNPEIPQECDWLHGAAMMIKGDLFTQFSLKFNEDYFLYFDDTDICYQIRSKGYKIIYWPKAIVRHAISTLSDTKNSKRIYYYLRGRTYFALKHGSLSQKIIYLFTFIIPCLFISIFKLIINKEKWLALTILQSFHHALTRKLGKQK